MINNKHFITRTKLTLVGLIVIVTFLISYLVKPAITYAQVGVGVACNAGGHPGVCRDRNTTSCPTYYDSGNYCPGGASIQCCVNSQVSCNPPEGAGACHNAYNGNVSCNGSFNPGNYCPGPQDVQCCVAIPPPTNVTGSCSASGTVATVNWTPVAGYSYYYARIHDETTNTEGSYSGVITGSSYSFNNAIPGHRYSYWVHTTNAAGSPYSSEVPTAHTATFTCAIPTCGDQVSLTGGVTSTGVATRTSAVRNNDTATYGGQNAVDGISDPSKLWNSGAGPTQWIELDLGATQPVSGIKLNVNQLPDGATIHQILTGANPNPTTVQRTLSCYTKNNDTISVKFSPELTNVRYVRVSTTASPSWVAWNEISVYGSAPGTQTTTPGIIFSGDGSATFGQGNASTKRWVVGGLTYPEVYPTTTNPSTTSYQYLLDKATSSKTKVTNLTTVSGCNNLNNCTLPANLTNGIYQANGNLKLNTYTFANNKSYVFLINGDLTILGNIVTPNGSTAIFSAKKDIIIDKNVGTATNLYPLPAGQLQGIFSADRDFSIQGINDCIVGKDKMLNVEGAIVTNALGNGGNFRTQRDLCGDNPNYPSLTIRLRLDFLLNAPTFIQKQSTTIREDAP